MNDTLVLDASALLAYLRDEPGGAAVAEALGQGTVISAVNLAEVLSKIADEGENPDELADRPGTEGLANFGVEVLPFTELDARIVARLRLSTRAAGLSLGDRACLALGVRLGYGVLTADRGWATLDLGVEVRLVR